jgi:hypothetical protein
MTGGGCGGRHKYPIMNRRGKRFNGEDSGYPHVHSVEEDGVEESGSSNTAGEGGEASRLEPESVYGHTLTSATTASDTQ